MGWSECIPIALAYATACPSLHPLTTIKAIPCLKLQFLDLLYV
jgi:hypothetical protein